MVTRLTGLAAFALTACLLSQMSPAAAQAARQPACFEIIGCPSRDVIRETDLRDFSCQNLWMTRNQIYFENYYCFRTAAGIQAFGNEGCRFQNDADVPLNAIEKRNVATIRRVEQAKSCR
jgi:hypothetical protein